MALLERDRDLYGSFQTEIGLFSERDMSLLERRFRVKCVL